MLIRDKQVMVISIAVIVLCLTLICHKFLLDVFRSPDLKPQLVRLQTKGYHMQLVSFVVHAVPLKNNRSGSCGFLHSRSTALF